MGDDSKNLGPIAAIGGSVSGIFGQMLANRANRKLQQKQLDWNEEMWHNQNEYNTPAAQMQRMREAGLNTSLMYGQGSSGNATSAAQGVAPPHMESVTKDTGRTISDYINLKMVDANIENIKADTAVKLKDADKRALESEGIVIANARNYQDYQMETQTYGNRLRRDQIETASTGLELIKLGIDKDRSIIQRDSELQNLIWKETEKMLSAAKSYADIQNTIIGTALSQQEYNHIKKMGYKIPSKIIGGIVSKLFGQGLGGPTYKLKEKIGDIPKSSWGDRRDKERHSNYKNKSSKWGGIPNIK